MIVKVEIYEKPEVAETESECKIIRFEPKPVFRMGKTGGNPENESLVYEMYKQALEPVISHPLNLQRA
jgi:hypothetical protein